MSTALRVLVIVAGLGPAMAGPMLVDSGPVLVEGGSGLAVAGPVMVEGGAGMLEGGGVLDGFVIGYVPGGAGASASDFAYEPEDGVGFTSRVWERETGDDGHAVDLTVIIVRADRFGTLGDLGDFMSEYHERDPASWTKVQVGAHPGLKAAAQVVWLVRPGVGVSVTIDAARFGDGELTVVAESVREQ
ncbi:hypothetical protein AB0O34_36510 [Sphaerisporangium sp. NPDC088356]|uniref:hypothetical protein n=1 Tax=Sphaerisporangium sp. NPDC088356 TaxID=3154871 RepID=UPI00343EA37D